MKTFISTVAALPLLAGMAMAQDVRIGNLLTYMPIDGKYTEIEAGSLGVDAEIIKFHSGGDVINAMASGSIDISLLGSSPTAAGFSRGVEMKVVYIYDNIFNAEALVVRDGSGITAPQDMVGKTIAVPFGSTTHFHMSFALEQFGLDGRKVNVIDMAPPDMVAAWERGDIDGAFVWEPALSRMNASGHVLFTSGDLSNWGKATFDAMVVRNDFAEEHPEIVCRFVKTAIEADADYNANPAAYGPGTEKGSAVAAAISGDADQAGAVLALYDFPSLDEQLSSAWLGGGAATALAATSEFLMEQGKIDAVLESYDAAVDPTFAQMVKDGGC